MVGFQDIFYYLFYYLLSSVFNKKRTSYIPVNGHQVMLRRLITADEANEKAFMENITENEKNEIKYVLGRS